MMNGVRNQMRAAAQLAQGGAEQTKIGIVTSYDPGLAAARVRLQPEDPDNPDTTLTGWLPVASGWVGDGWGIDAPVSPGDQVEVKYVGAEIENGYIAGRFFSDSVRPTGAKSGEFFLTHKSGSKLHFHNDGTVTLVSAGTLTSQAPQWNHTGPVVIDGTLQVVDTITGQGGLDVSGDAGAGKSLSITGDTNFTGSVTANGKHIDHTHVHSNGNGGANTGAPVS
jgi:phage baseplate assembly protein V